MYMKRMLATILVLLLCASGALAEEYWTANEDWYYHQSALCGGRESMVPISPDGAEEFGKYACPVCVQQREEYGEPKAVNCFGQLAVRVPESWLWDLEYKPSPELIDGVHERGAEALRTLGQCLHGRAYVQFLEEWKEGGAASGTEYFASVERMNCDILSLRHIGGAWYAGVRPEEDPMQGWEMLVRSLKIELEMTGDALDTHMNTEPKLTSLTLVPEEVMQIYQRENSEMLVWVYPLLDAYYLELILNAETDDAIRLRVGGEEMDVELWPTQIQGKPHFGCAITEAEFRALEAGAELEIID